MLQLVKWKSLTFIVVHVPALILVVSYDITFVYL